MEEKERYELTDTDCILDTERNIVVSDVFDVITNADIITDLLNQQDKRIKKLEAENKNLNKQLSLTEKAYKIAIFELDFARHHSQSTSQETVDRIEKLESEIWNKAKEKMKSE